MLTEPHGLNYITHCEEEGFHVHPKEPPLYEVSGVLEWGQLVVCTLLSKLLWAIYMHNTII